MASVICLDFDDTLVLDNTARQVFEQFADPGWRRFAADYRDGRLSVEQFNAAAFDLISVDISGEIIRRFAAETARPRDGVLELTDWAHWHGWLVAVVSNGFDLYVDPVLDKLGLDRVARHCGRTSSEYRWRVRYFSPRGIEVSEGFKLSYAAAFRNAGDFVVYCGDGASDIAAARLAGAVFARDTLLRELGGHPRTYGFDTFHDVVRVLDAESEGWLAAFAAGTTLA
jgi:2-hydroxy-3-keto-5-methylthiopentenyl-1-phosphate phosphatase